MKIKDKINSHCKHLRLAAIGQQVQPMADQAATDQISYLDFAEKLLEVEIKHRHQRDLERKLCIY